MGLGSSSVAVHGVLRAPPAVSAAEGESRASTTSGGFPGYLVQRPRTPSRDPTAIASPLLQKAAARNPSAPQMAARRWWSESTRRPLARIWTRYTESSDATDTSQCPVEEKVHWRTPFKSHRVSCTCCSKSQPFVCHTRKVWSIPQETKRDSKAAPLGEDARQLMLSEWPFSIFSSVSENAFQICSCPVANPQIIHQPSQV
mmetsp:Transcript_44092/g.127506  ORF Transcript_44092/g.127506 Transcript_44092/m.127506 type:complete len:201 (-) Transcript_44092:738-1340(-)